MTQTFGSNSNNDIYLGTDGNLVILSGQQAVEAACATTSKAQLGEMVLFTGQGIPNFQVLWVGTPNYAIWQSYLRNALLNVDGVIDVTDLQLNTQNNTLSYTATIKTIYGTSQLSV